jgi:organic hydroperoxide reductase OsmC/OhrA
MHQEHHFAVTTNWTGNRGVGTASYRSYGRDTVISANGKPPIEGSSARVFHGDSSRWNPEELLIAALSQCHMLSFLHVATNRGVVVTSYDDNATGILALEPDGGGHFTSVTLRPTVTVANGDLASVAALHREAKAKCFIAASMNFPITHEPVTFLEPVSPVV